MRKLETKVALITGGNSGIGLATAKLFRDEGAKVIITASSARSFEKAKRELSSDYDVIQTDVASSADLDRLYSTIKSKYGGIDVLFANAGIALFRPTEQIDEKFFDEMVSVNFRGLFFTVAKSIPHLNDGSSVILTSTSSNNKGMPGSSVYSATKAAVRSLARTWTAEIPTSKARFNVLSPGPIDTPIFEKMGLTHEQARGMTDQLLPSIPSHRLGQPNEIAHAALFLASRDSSFVMGSEFFVDGGISQI